MHHDLLRSGDRLNINTTNEQHEMDTLAPRRRVPSRGSGSYLGARVGSFIRACIVTPFANQNDAPSTPDEDATSRKRKAPRVFTTPCESLTCCLRYDKRTVTGRRAVADQHTAR